jgi:hypothetical protein
MLVHTTTMPTNKLSTAGEAGEATLSTQSQPSSEAQGVTERMAEQVGGLLGMETPQTRDCTFVVRVRPLSSAEQRECDGNRERKAVTVWNKTISLQSYASLHDGSYTAETQCHPKLFTFDAVLNELESTDTAFHLTGAPAVKQVIRGVSAVVIAYGQTGSGKTHSLLGEWTHSPHTNKNKKQRKRGGAAAASVDAMGVDGPGSSGGDDDDNYEVEGGGLLPDRKLGIASMAFELLRKSLAQRTLDEGETSSGTVEYGIEVSAVEVYMNRVYDLLSNSDDRELKIRARTIRQTLSHLGGQGFELLPQETHVPCHDLAQFEHVLHNMVSKRVQGREYLNFASSRSHLIITLAVRRTVRPHSGGHTHSSAGIIDPEKEYMSKLTLVDLAGSRRSYPPNQKGTSNEGNLGEDDISVNESLLALTRCLKSRSDLYRAAALTKLLKEPLTSAKIFFLACCSPVASSVNMTSQTLSYAATVRAIKTSAEDTKLVGLGKDKLTLEFLPHSALVEHGKIPRSSEGLKTVYLHELRVSVVRVMISHRWLSPSCDLRLSHPDSKEGHKHALLCTLFQRLGEKGWINNYDVCSVVHWIDYSECCHASPCDVYSSHL